MLHAKVAILGGALVLTALPLRWITTGVGPASSASRGTDLVAVWAPTALAGSVVLVFATLWWRFGRDDYSLFAAFAAGFLFLFLLVMLVAIESASGLIPTAFLPATLRRSSSAVAAGAGVWVSLGGALLALLAASPAGSWLAGLHTWDGRRSRVRLGAALFLLGLTAAVGWLRYEPWVGSSLLGESFDLTGQAAPWIGPISLAAVCLLVGALVLAALSLFEAAGLVATAAGWLISCLAAIAAISSEALVKFRLGKLLDSLSGHGVTFHTAPAVWGTYLSGLLIAGVGGFLVWWQYRSGGG